jgi:hypothetical protein
MGKEDYYEDEFETELANTARNKREAELIQKYIKGERVRAFLLHDKAGQSINEEVQRKISSAIDSFWSCEPGDTESLIKAKQELELAKGIIGMFTAIFNDQQDAENQLNDKG